MTKKTYRATMKDVAQKAGVTIGTVSHVINHTAPISEETTQRVQEAIEQLHYVPNSFARNIRVKKNNRIGLMIPNLTNTFYSKTASCFVSLAAQYKQVVHIMGYEYSLEREIEGIRSLMEYNVGTIVIVNGSGDEEMIREVAERGIHVILADRRSKMENIPYVEFENSKTYQEIVKMLREKGYHSIGFICEPLDMINQTDRYEGYLKGMEENGFPIIPEHIHLSKRLYLDYLKQSYHYMKDLLAEKTKEELPEAFIMTSDLLAIGAIRAIHEAGYRVPEDFGIIGCDNLEMSGYVQPRLSTVDQNTDDLCREIWKMILDLRREKKIKNVVLPQRIILRESC